MNFSYIKGLYAIADSAWNPCASLPELVLKFLMGGCKLVQLRMKATPHRGPLARGERGWWHDEVFEVAKEIIKFKRNFSFTFIINDYVDVAVEVRADGVHVGKNDAPISEIRRRVGNRLLIGYSTHSFKEAIQAEVEGADYVALGAIYPTATKGPGHPVVGVDTLRRVTSQLKVPVVAIGGITRENYKRVFEAGASAAAMITALAKAKDIVDETRFLCSRVQGGMSDL